MSIWWDADAGRYRSTVVHKLLFVWCWPTFRFVLFLLPSETAHHMAIRALRIAGWLDRIWRLIVLLSVVLVLLLIRVLTLLPWFTCDQAPVLTRPSSARTTPKTRVSDG